MGDKLKKVLTFAKTLWNNDKFRKTVYLLFFMLGIIAIYNFMYSMDFIDKKRIYARYIKIAFASFAALMIISNIKKDRPNLSGFVILLFNTFMSYFFMESLTYTVNGGRLWSLQYIFNLIIILGVYLVFWAISGKVKITVILGNILFAAASIGNRMLIDLRGRPLFLSDIFSVTTALNISNQYTIEYFKYAVMGFLFVVMTAAIFVIMYKKNESKFKIGYRILFLIPMLTVVLLTAKTDIYNNLGIQMSYWRHNNGVILDWVIEAKDFKVKPPEDYSAEALRHEEELIEEEKRWSEFKKPNILAIMSESYSDLHEIGEFETTEEYMPYFNYLCGKNSPYFVTGKLYSSVYGGNTANSEYEFLTGDSTLIYPQNSIPYQTFLDGKTSINSLVSQLESLGYDTFAMHPYIATGWNRPNIYKAMGFDETLFIEDIEASREVERVREYCSDKTNTDIIIERFENKEKGKPLFMFNVTMQNHGGYTDSDFENNIQIVGKEGMYPKAEQYMSLMRLSDTELERLIAYFKDYDEPTVIVFFGDHQPKIDTEFYEDLMGKKMSEFTTEEMQKLYVTRYLIWSNEKLKDDGVRDTSINYLSTHMMRLIGMPTTKYQKYLIELQKYYPIITANVKVNSYGTMTPINGEGSEELKMYRFMIYNHVLDDSTYQKSFFEYSREN